MAMAKALPARNVYRCKEILATAWDTSQDYAVFRLDRAVPDRDPAAVHWSGDLPQQPAFVIGQPSGLPQKLARGAVTDGVSSEFVVHNADVFNGNSGGGLFDTYGQLIGIHVKSSGQRYVWNDSRTCMEVAVCGENATCGTPPQAFDTRAVKKRLTAALREELGAD
jgi:hypothetical protein